MPVQEDAVAVQVTHEELDTIIKTNYKVAQAIFLWGETGIGKSEKVKTTTEEIASQEYSDREFVKWNEVSKERKEEIVESPEDFFVLMDIRMSQFEPSDIKGIPDLSNEGAVTWKPPLWVYMISRENAAGVVFLDEANQAPNSVQKAFFQLILDKEVGEYSISDEVYVLGAGNRAKDQANVYEMSAPLRDRFNHYQLKRPTAGQDGTWTDWAIQEGLNDQVVGFLASPVGSDKISTFEGENKNAKSFATPRSWERVSKLLDQLKEDGNDDLNTSETILASVVGEGVAKEFRGFLKVREKADLQKYMENPEAASEISDEDTDLKYSILTGVAAEYRQDTDVLPQLIKIAKHIDQEFGILLLRLAKNYHNRHFKENVVDIPEFQELSEDYAKYLLN